MKKTNYHTHCHFCDGKESPQAMAQEAERRGFQILGFSSHAMYPFSNEWHIGAKDFAAYCTELEKLKEAYRGRMEILAGFEADFIPGLCSPDRESYRDFSPDFIVASVHYVMGDGGYFEADGPADETRKRIGRFFGGDAQKAVRRYFESERQMLSLISPSSQGGFPYILAHADLVRKQNGGGSRGAAPLFSEDAPWYREELERTADAIAEAKVVVEINTGGMARGYMDSPYPSPAFLRLLHERHVLVTLSSDAHQSCALDFAFDQATRTAQRAGYQELAYIDGSGVRLQKIG